MRYDTNLIHVDKGPGVYCQAIDSDGDTCTRYAKEEVDGHHLCGIHVGVLGRENTARMDSLDKYREYQEKEFANIARSLSDDDLHARNRDLMTMTTDNSPDYRRVRIEVERDAVAAELTRRNG